MYWPSYVLKLTEAADVPPVPGTVRRDSAVQPRPLHGTADSDCPTLTAAAVAAVAAAAAALTPD